jgi:uncharacterized protein (DUF3084 family)
MGDNRAMRWVRGIVMARKGELLRQVDMLKAEVEARRQESVALRKELAEVRHELMVSRLNERQARHSAAAAKRAFQRAWNRCVYEDRTLGSEDIN